MELDLRPGAINMLTKRELDELMPKAYDDLEIARLKAERSELARMLSLVVDREPAGGDALSLALWKSARIMVAKQWEKISNAEQERKAAPVDGDGSTQPSEGEEPGDSSVCGEGVPGGGQEEG